MKKILLLIVIGVLFSQTAQAAIEPRGPSKEEPLASSTPAAPIPPQGPEAPKPEVHLPKKLQAQPSPELPETNKIIIITLADQTLKYFEGQTEIGEFKISSGLPGTPTPPGQYSVLIKKPAVDYKGLGYNFPNTKWNLMFKRGSIGNYYIHGVYWHHNFGQPMSHGCINVAYEDVEPLYNWADVGTKIDIE